MRDELLYVDDMVDAATHIMNFVRGKAFDDFVSDDILRSAVVFQLVVIGEAAAQISRGFRAAHPEIFWHRLSTFRNLLAHEYFALDWELVWHTATESIPALLPRLEALRNGCVVTADIKRTLQPCNHQPRRGFQACGRHALGTTAVGATSS